MIVLLPVLLIWSVVTAAYVLSSRRDRRVPADDIGVLWLGVVALYATLPSLWWLYQGGSYGVLSDARLLRLQPDSREVSYLLNIALAYTCGFALVYFVLRSRVPKPMPSTYPRISMAKMSAALAIVLVFQTALLLMAVGGFSGTSESYIDSYRVILELPLAVRQVLKIANGIASVATLVLLIAILQRWPGQRLLLILYIGVVLLSFDPEGSRAAAATRLLFAAISWHVLIRPIPARLWLSAGFLGLALFIALGLRRALGSWETFGVLDIESFGLGEFESQWTNAIELLQAREFGELDVPATVRFGELWSFIPSQLLPFEKLSLSNWFVHTFYPAYEEAGGGLAFGAISQAVIGAGIPEAALRGAVLGVLAAWLMKWYRTPSSSWWRLPLYLFLLVFVFQSVRDTTFRLLNDVVHIVIPALFLVAITGYILATACGGRRPQPDGENPPSNTNA